MVTAAGLGAAYGGYQRARQADVNIESGEMANETARTGLEADKAWGNTIPVLQQMLQPGATQMPQTPPMGAPAGGMPPQAPPPGQSSQPMQAAPPERTMSPQGGGPPVGVYNQSQFNPMDAQAAAPPAGGQPQMLGGPAPPGPQGSPAVPQGAPPGAPPQQAGRLDLHTVMAAVVKANPGAKPQVIAAAVAKALPLMTAQSQQDYKVLMTQLAAGRLDNARTGTAIRGEEADRRQEQGDRRLNQGDTRLEQQGGELRSRQEYRTDQGARSDARIYQGQQRIDQGNTRLEQQGGEYASRDTRRQAQTDQGGQRLDIQRGREARLQAQNEIRNDQRYLQLEQQAKALETRIQQGGDRAALSQWRAIVDAQHKRALEIIQSGRNAIGVMDPEERKALVKEQNDFYRQQIEQMRKGPARPERPAGADTTGLKPPGKLGDQPPASGPPGAQGGAPRPQARNPKTGEMVEFDGTNWVPVTPGPQSDAGTSGATDFSAARRQRPASFDQRFSGSDPSAMQSEPGAADWAGAQARDLYETGKTMIGVNDPKYRGGTYEPFENTKKVRDKAILADKLRRQLRELEAQ